MAVAIGNAHEYRLNVNGSKSERVDSARDLRNNSITRSYARKNLSTLLKMTNKSLEKLAKKLWAQGYGVRL